MYNKHDMWQSGIETECYSVMYFKCIAEYDVLYIVLSFRAGLIYASYMHQIFIERVYEARP